MTNIMHPKTTYVLQFTNIAQVTNQCTK